MWLIFDFGSIGWQTTPRNHLKIGFRNLAGVTIRDPMEGAKIILKLLFLIPPPVLIKNQRALYNTENC